MADEIETTLRAIMLDPGASDAARTQAAKALDAMQSRKQGARGRIAEMTLAEIDDEIERVAPGIADPVDPSAPAVEGEGGAG